MLFLCHISRFKDTIYFWLSEQSEKVAEFFLQKPEIVFADCGGDAAVGEIGGYLRDHFGIFDGYGEVLLLDGFPIDAAELINLVDEPFYGVLIE